MCPPEHTIRLPQESASIPASESAFPQIQTILEDALKACAKYEGALQENRQKWVAGVSQTKKRAVPENRHWLETIVPSVPRAEEEDAPLMETPVSPEHWENLERSKAESRICASHLGTLQKCLDILNTLPAHPKELDFLVVLRAEAHEYALELERTFQEGRGLEARPEYLLTVLIQYQQILRG